MSADETHLPQPAQTPDEGLARQNALLQRRLANLENTPPHAIVVEGTDPRGGFTESPPRLGTLVLTTQRIFSGSTFNSPQLWVYTQWGLSSGVHGNAWFELNIASVDPLRDPGSGLIYLDGS